MQAVYNNYKRAAGLAALAATMALTCAGAATARTITLDAGTVIPVTLNDSLSSRDSNKGDQFSATVKPDAAAAYGLPQDTTIEGHVRNAWAKEGKKPGVLTLSFDRLQLPDETSIPITGSLIGLDNKSVTHTSSGRLVAKSDHRNQELAYAGYGAGAGLILGAITRGNTLEDTLLGGGLGYLFGTLNKSHGETKDVYLDPGTSMGVRLDHSVTFSAYGDSGQGSGRFHRTSGYNGSRINDSANNTDPDYYERNGNLDENNTSYSDDDLGVMVDNQDIQFAPEAAPFLKNDTAMLPVIPVLRAEHVPYHYDNNQLVAEGPYQPITATFGDPIVAGSHNHRFRLAQPVQWIHGAIYAPARFFALTTGKKVTYDSGSHTVIIGSNAYGAGP